MVREEFRKTQLLAPILQVNLSGGELITGQVGAVVCLHLAVFLCHLVSPWALVVEGHLEGVAD